MYVMGNPILYNDPSGNIYDDFDYIGGSEEDDPFRIPKRPIITNRDEWANLTPGIGRKCSSLYVC